VHEASSFENLRQIKNETTINADDEHTTVQKKHTDVLPN